MTSDRTILITGVTGNQGGAVARALQGTGFGLRGLTRMPEGERAAALARQAQQVHVLFNNCYQDYGVRNAEDLVELLLERGARPDDPPRQ